MDQNSFLLPFSDVSLPNYDDEEKGGKESRIKAWQ
jgi:hypothetical protein